MTYIVIEGVIGVGKTALTRLLGEQFDVPTFFERIKENPFLNSLTQYELSGAVCVPLAAELHLSTLVTRH